MDFYLEILASLSVQFSMSLTCLLIGLVVLYLSTKKKKLLTVIFLNFLLLVGLLMPILNFYYLQKTPRNSSQEGLTILSTNLLYTNTNTSQIQSIIASKDPDVIIFIEFSSYHYEQLKPFLDENYPFSFTIPYLDSENQIFSKYELQDPYNGNTNPTIYTKARVVKDGKEYTIYGLHTSAPINQGFFQYRNQQLADLADDMNNDPAKNIIAAGDFNLAPWSRHYKKFEKEVSPKYRNISNANGLTFTWRPPHVTFLASHIDHAFISNDLQLSDFEVVEMPGSDHKALFFRVSPQQ